MSYWSVVQCISRKEQVVVDRLERIGYRCYLPKIQIDKTRIAAFYPGYLFLQIHNAWYPARWTQGVCGLHMTCNQTGLETMIELTQKRERNGIIPATRPIQFHRGQKLRVINGPFAGHIGQCAGLKGADRTLVFLEMFGQLAPVELPNRDIAPLDVAVQSRG